jgi:hypothetical protein
VVKGVIFILSKSFCAGNIPASIVFCMLKKSPDESGVRDVHDLQHRLEEEEKLQDVPAITRQVLENVEKLMGRMTGFFADIFYSRPHWQGNNGDIISKLGSDLLASKIENDYCSVHHMLRDIKGVRDEIVISTRRALVLFHCEPQETSNYHPSPRYPSLKYINPDDGLIIQPRHIIKTLNLGQVEFEPEGVFERRDYPNAWHDEEKAAWDVYEASWRAGNIGFGTEAGPVPAQESIGGAMLNLVGFRRKEKRPHEPHSERVFATYTDFHRRLQNIAFTIETGLNAINDAALEAKQDHPSVFDNYTSY